MRVVLYVVLLIDLMLYVYRSCDSVVDIATS